MVRVSDFEPKGCGLEQVTFTPCLVLVKPRKWWMDNRLGQTVTRLETMLCLYNVLSPRDLVSGPDKTDETVPHTPRSLVPRLGLGTTWVRQLLSGSWPYPTAATKCNVATTQTNPFSGKPCPPTKGGLICYLCNLYLYRILSSL